jgi:hypothetical protein
MIRADFEIVFSLLIVGYYVYTFIAKNREKKSAPQTDSTPPGKKKKTFLDDFLEELEKQQKANMPKTEVPVPEPVMQRRNPNSSPKPKKAAAPRKEPVAQWFSPEMEGGLTTMTSTFASEEQPVLQKKKHAGKIVFGSTVLSPKDAIVAQLLFERRF